MVRSILYWPHPTLRTKSKFGDDLLDMSAEEKARALSTLIPDLLDTMEHHRGLGLAAVQIGIPVPVFVARLQDHPQRVFIAPTIFDRSNDREAMAEGCLSLPGVFENVTRHTSVRVTAWDENGQHFSLPLRGQDAQVVQHEYDHLQGKMYPDRMDPGARDRLRAHMRKQRR